MNRMCNNSIRELQDILSKKFISTHCIKKHLLSTLRTSHSVKCCWTTNHWFVWNMLLLLPKYVTNFLKNKSMSITIIVFFSSPILRIRWMWLPLCVRSVEKKLTTQNSLTTNSRKSQNCFQWQLPLWIIFGNFRGWETFKSWEGVLWSRMGIRVGQRRKVKPVCGFKS